jgi:hypothetical protein
VSAPAFGRAEIDAFLAAAAAELEGEWLLLGGAAAALWFLDDRVTADIDLIGLAGTTDDRLRLMDLAAAHGLPIEAVNSAADFFVRRIPGWRDEIEVLRPGPRATIYRPTPTLFLLLKCGRLSEQDLADCQALLAFADTHGLALDRDRVRTALAALPATNDAALAARRARLESALRT